MPPPFSDDAFSLPVAQPINTDVIPVTLRRIPHWICWRYELKDGRATKIPVCALTGRKAAVNRPGSWCDFDRAGAAYRNPRLLYSGLGFVVADETIASGSVGIVGVDIDHCFDAEGGMSDLAAVTVAELDTYTEVSPSGTGLRIWGLGELPPGRRKKPDFEMYCGGRFLTVTGDVVRGGDLEARPVEILSVWRREFGDLTAAARPAEPAPRPTAQVSDSDAALLDMARQAGNGDKFSSLYDRGDLTAHSGDHSAADMALCSLLAFYAQGNHERVDRLFRASGLMREKWLRDDYRGWTIAKAVEGCRSFYDPSYQSGDPKYDRGVDITIGGDAPRKAATLDQPSNEPQGESAPTQYDYEWSAADDEAAKKEREKIRRDELKRERRGKRTNSARLADDLPIVETNNQHLRHVTDSALDALLAANEPPLVFVRGGRLARIGTDEHKRPVIEALAVDTLRGRLARVANFISTSDDRGSVPMVPPGPVVADLLSLGAWDGVPPLDGIVTAPVVGADGELERAPGYLAGAALFYYEPDPRPVDLLAPTDENVAAAVTLIRDTVLGGFPFTDEAGRAHAMALLLLPFVRPYIHGATPIHLIDAPTPGTGKGLLVEAVTGVFIPGGATLTPGDVKDDDEWRKRITTTLKSGGSHAWFDNINKKVESGSLAAAITAQTWRDRLLGQNEEAQFPVRCCWVATGNNVQMSDEITRRSIGIRIDSKVERPWDREDFKIADLRGYVRDNRPLLLGAVLTILDGWIRAGRPLWGGRPMGSFEHWSQVVGGVLGWCGIEGFLANRNEVFERTDPERQKWHGFFEAWFENFGDQPRGVKDVYQLAVTEELVEGNESRTASERRILGRMLAGNCDRVFGRFRLTRGDTLHRAVQFIVKASNDVVTTAQDLDSTEKDYHAVPPSPEDEPGWWNHSLDEDSEDDAV